jgi:hypothetical protein
MENQTPKLAEVDTTKTQEAMKELMAAELNLNPVFKAVVLDELDHVHDCDEEITAYLIAKGRI